MRKDPLFETFLEKTSLIMLEEEIETYRHLPDVASKREFIAEFWRVRDPSPDTEENEARNEFERRVAFANQWFDLFGSCRGHIAQHRASKPAGWNSDLKNTSG
jgi:GWxTD domain-containing protein